ncbi:hypothetical protein [Micromonospora chokoriensis]|uniref:Uncharacterized protein n=1 Tax=Micromonospora chokoriensis TaxID=356851 RepID=A0A1C4VKB5_9ACTN|nr:hypothetical protein [Micromonospora chokoriensis]SCE84442.1 hypothetical protein GA0070612_1536 [Micromonospora chokoriensis]
MSDTVVLIVRRVLLPVSLLFGLMVLLGVLVTRVFARTWPFTVEDSVNRELAADRTGGWNDVSLVFGMAIMVRAVLDRGLRWGRATLPTGGRPVVSAGS